ncbi:hypothetical protein J8F10_21430 [Gemmata sp. G18]|uniref:Uncharacterized protein n=1 Tax=Gemmata palustris TaxID=2822762 RepID=A0ABS5BY67_9BACT|nr:hypothetical protein [Gemmata palustris]MBP3957823.1 hypothetical protein [Gemmata palustris]
MNDLMYTADQAIDAIFGPSNMPLLLAIDMTQNVCGIRRDAILALAVAAERSGYRLGAFFDRLADTISSDTEGLGDPIPPTITEADSRQHVPTLLRLLPPTHPHTKNMRGVALRVTVLVALGDLEQAYRRGRVLRREQPDNPRSKRGAAILACIQFAAVLAHITRRPAV